MKIVLLYEKHLTSHKVFANNSFTILLQNLDELTLSTNWNFNKILVCKLSVTFEGSFWKPTISTMYLL